MQSLESLQALWAPLLPGLMGIAFREAGAERVVATLVARTDLCTTGGALHGGALMALADTLGAVGTLQNLPAGTGTTTSIPARSSFAAFVKARP
ncbi:MAG: PaaI family thioesterase [Burkholderiales bacterium]